MCQPAACGTGGVTCAVGCPTTVPEAANLVLWLVGDAYTAGPNWLDLSGRGADAICSTCPSTGTGLNGHSTVSFDGSSYFVLSDPGAQYRTQSWTMFVVAAPDPAAPSNAQLLAFSSGSDSLALQRSGGDNDLLFELLPGSAPGGIVAPGAWAGAWEQIVAAVDATQSGSLEVGGSTATATIGSPGPGRPPLGVPRDRSGVAHADLRGPGRRDPGLQHDPSSLGVQSPGVPVRSLQPALTQFFGRAQTPNS